MDLGIAGRRAVVTGASRGIGAAIARGLAAEGAEVVLHGRDEEALAAVARDCGAGATVVAADALDPELPARLAVQDADVLVLNAGTSYAKPLLELGDEDLRALHELHVVGPHRLSRVAAPAMAGRGWGRIVHVTSSAAKRPSQTNVAYGASKAAQASLARAYADAYAGQGVLVNAVAPGATSSPLWVGEGGLADQAAKGGSREDALAAQAAKLPLGRFATPEEIAAVVVFLCSERAATVAGAHWSADGGTVATVV